MNPLAIAQLAAQLTVSAVTGKVIGNVISTNRPQTSDITVQVASGLGGYVVSEKLKPTTDALVINAAARIRTFRSKN
jgi:hypothetical protein